MVDCYQHVHHGQPSLSISRHCTSIIIHFAAHRPPTVHPRPTASCVEGLDRTHLSNSHSYSMHAGMSNTSGLAPGRAPFVLPPAPISSIRTTTPNNGRPLRSRRNRPCDHCRRAKARCTIDARGPPCLLCSETDRQCTFDAAPPARKPRASTTAPSESVEDDSLSPGQSTRRRRSTSMSHSPSNRRRSHSPPRITSSSSASRVSAGPTRPSRLPVSELSSFDHLAKSDKYDAHGERCILPGRPHAQSSLLFSPTICCPSRRVAMGRRTAGHM